MLKDRIRHTSVTIAADAIGHSFIDSVRDRADPQ
jgi:hypothetical protein